MFQLMLLACWLPLQASAAPMALEPAGPAFAVSPFPAPQSAPQVEAIGDGFVVVWEEGYRGGGVILPVPTIHSRDGDGIGSVLQTVSVQGPADDAMIVSGDLPGDQARPGLAVQPDDSELAVVWNRRTFGAGKEFTVRMSRWRIEGPRRPTSSSS